MAPTEPVADRSSAHQPHTPPSPPCQSRSSSSSPSSSNDSDGDDGQNNDTPMPASVSSIPTLPRRQKPDISRTAFAPGSSALLSRLSSFLPELAAANASLEEDRLAGRLGERNIENVDEEDGGQYIEMNLGLGVLEEKDPNASSSSSDSDTSSDSDSDDSNDDESDKSNSKTNGAEATKAKDRTVMDSLMGTKSSKSKSKPAIEEVEEG
ncbi:MAG: hypothetical protein M1819_000325 [Sarea resinae]|nr:MAG: hypothetical protein M1819_000325 [Sarea resinae]